MISRVDYNQNKVIDYSEFMTATLEPDILKQPNVLEGLFNQFDLDNNGTIDKEEMVKTFSKFGKEISLQEVNKIMNLHDLTDKGEIDFHSFKHMIQDDIHDDQHCDYRE